MRGSLHSREIASAFAIWLVSLATGLCVFGIAVFLQWLVYNDWMHDHAPLRWVGSLISAALAAFVVARWQFALRHRRMDMLRRFETIRWMNDRIRNALQTIDLVAFVHSKETEAVSSAVDAIGQVLEEVLAEAHPGQSNNVHGQSRERNQVEVER